MSSNYSKTTDEQKQDTSDENTDVVAILDAGAQYGKLIDRRVRELNIKSVLIPFNTPSNQLKKYKAIIISGGPSSVYADNAPKYDANLFNLNIPILAICYGFQLMVHVFKGVIERGHEREDGQFELDIKNESLLFNSINSSKINVLLTHGDIVKKMPSGFNVIATSSNGIISAGENTKLNIYGVQFHPEVDLTEDGKLMFNNFLYKICKLSGNYTLKNRMNTAIDYIKQKVGKNKKVLCLVSGGVDSSVCCALLHKALEDNDNNIEQDILDIAEDCVHLLKHKKHQSINRNRQIYPVHVDHGLMRHNESVEVVKALEAIGVHNIHLENAQDYFLNGTTMINGKETLKLSETINPEHKRKIIGNLFMKLCDKVVEEDIFKDDKQNINKITFDDMLLVQGTLRPDLIESASKIANKGGTADVIKTHHNDTELVRRLRDLGRVIEPLTDYHKDEVRMIGTKLGLPDHLVWRQPFPGPGLAIRIICSDGIPYTTAKYDSDILDQLNNQFTSSDVSCCLLGFRTVGVQGDGRSYAHCVGLTVGVEDEDNIDWDILYNLAKDIPRKCKHVNRCIFIYGNKLSGKQQSVTPTYLQSSTIQQLRKCDKIVNDILFKYDLLKKISQVPVVLFPSNFGNTKNKNERSICIRTFITNDFMTGVPAKINKDIKQEIVFEMFEKILKIDGIQRVAFDLTAKPPGTTEWE